MKTLGTRNIFSSLAIYLGVAALTHAFVISDYFVIPTGREDLITSGALESTTLALQIFAYLLAVTALNLLPLILILTSFSTLHKFLVKAGLSPGSYFAITSLSFWLAALSFNAVYFPRSAFAILLPFGSESQSTIIGAISLTLYLALGVLPAVHAGIKQAVVLAKKLPIRFALSLALIAGMTQPIYSWESTPASVTNQPNVIVIGIDSLSPLHLEHHPGELNNLETIFRDATVFTNTITPLARTFPAWTSILTAQYPVNHGARFNLTRFDQVNHEYTLAHILKDQGYTTIYAQDERKFNNIDEMFGFDETVGPKPGAAEFVLTKVSDHPVANLALLLPGSEQLFPFISLNRADDIHYDPEEFVEATLEKLPLGKSKPIFLAAHFCLAHYPYTWRTRSKADLEGEANTLSIDQQHIGALDSLEKQVDILIQGLKNQGRLENALLVVLSDHGESLGYEDGLWPSADGNLKEVSPAQTTKPFHLKSGVSGHGGNVLDRTQYQSVLAFRAFGSLKDRFPASKHDNITSLTDVMPTILAALNIESPANIDGVDLMRNTPPPETNNRTVITETGISFKSMVSIENLNEEAVLKEAQKFYTIDQESARLVVKQEHYQDLVSVKDIAVHTDDWMLAFLRQNLNPLYKRVTVLVNKRSGEWTMGDNASLIGQAPLSQLTRPVKQLYTTEISDFQGSWALD